MKSLKVVTLSINDFIRDDDAASFYFKEMIKQDIGDGFMKRTAIVDILMCSNMSGYFKVACVSHVELSRKIIK